jgi:hypothetical protein
MYRTLALAAFALSTAATPAFAADRGFSIGNFEKLRVDGPYTVRVHTGSRVSVSAHGPQRKLERLQVELRDGTLVISTEKSAFNLGWGMGEHEEVVVNITVPMLTAASLNGSGDVSIDRIKTPAFETALVGSGDLVINRIDTGRLSAVLTGSGDLSLTGHAQRAETIVRGSGDLKAGMLSADAVNASVTGAGDLTVGTACPARVNLVGSGDVSIGGHPKCTISKHGSGDVRCG